MYIIVSSFRSVRGVLVTVHRVRLAAGEEICDEGLLGSVNRRGDEGTQWKREHKRSYLEVLLAAEGVAACVRR